MPEISRNILHSMCEFVKQNSHLASPPYQVRHIQDTNGGPGIEVWTAVGEKTSKTHIWIEDSHIHFQDPEIKWSIDDPSIDIGMTALVLLENQELLHRVAEDARRGRELNLITDNIRERAGTLRKELVSMCQNASEELGQQLHNDPNVVTVGYTAGAPVEIIIIYTVQPAREGQYPKEFKGFIVESKVMGPTQPAVGE